MRGDREFQRGGALCASAGDAWAASHHALRRAGRLARGFQQHAVALLSGLAYGLDTAVHEAPIATGGRTVALQAAPVRRTPQSWKQ